MPKRSAKTLATLKQLQTRFKDAGLNWIIADKGTNGFSVVDSDRPHGFYEAKNYSLKGLQEWAEETLAQRSQIEETPEVEVEEAPEVEEEVEEEPEIEPENTKELYDPQVSNYVSQVFVPKEILFMGCEGIANESEEKLKERLAIAKRLSQAGELTIDHIKENFGLDTNDRIAIANHLARIGFSIRFLGGDRVEVHTLVFETSLPTGSDLDQFMEPPF